MKNDGCVHTVSRNAPGLFRVEREEYSNRTFRMPVSLLDRMYAIVEAKNISLNKLVVLCCQYALDHMEGDEESPQEDEHVEL